MSMPSSAAIALAASTSSTLCGKTWNSHTNFGFAAPSRFLASATNRQLRRTVSRSPRTRYCSYVSWRAPSSDTPSTSRPDATRASARAASKGMLKFVLVVVEMPRALASRTIVQKSLARSGSPQLVNSIWNRVSPSSASRRRYSSSGIALVLRPSSPAPVKHAGQRRLQMFVGSMVSLTG